MSESELAGRLNVIASKAKAERNLDKLALLGLDAMEVVKPVHPAIVEIANELMGKDAPEWFVRPEKGRNGSPIEQMARGDSLQLKNRLVFAKVIMTMGT